MEGSPFVDNSDKRCNPEAHWKVDREPFPRSPCTPVFRVLSKEEEGEKTSTHRERSQPEFDLFPSAHPPERLTACPTNKKTVMLLHCCWHAVERTLYEKRVKQPLSLSFSFLSHRFFTPLQNPLLPAACSWPALLPLARPA